MANTVPQTILVILDPFRNFSVFVAEQSRRFLFKGARVATLTRDKNPAAIAKNRSHEPPL
jgi:hypothetical protein